ncbi:MAG: hypothetical protein ACREML_14075 [Vulcanimicrobiaceae bacterium]
MMPFLLAALLAQASPAKSAVVVHMNNFAFVPATIHVNPVTRSSGLTTIPMRHTVDSAEKLFDSGGLDTHEQYTHVFSKGGSFAYFAPCIPI